MKRKARKDAFKTAEDGRLIIKDKKDYDKDSSDDDNEVSLFFISVSFDFEKKAIIFFLISQTLNNIIVL